jgi:peptidoglycan/LPS O-acetylase OafA/YrhL
LAGKYSYSVYFLHFFVVFRAARLVNEHLMATKSFYVAESWAVVFYAAMIPVGFLSFRYVEEPFLRFRAQYLREPDRVLATYGPPVPRSV